MLCALSALEMSTLSTLEMCALSALEMFTLSTLKVRALNTLEMCALLAPFHNVLAVSELPLTRDGWWYQPDQRQRCD